MKKLTLLNLLLYLLISISYGQLDPKTQFNFYQEIRDKAEKADRSDFHYIPKKPGHYTAKDWQTVIDSTWGEGMPTAKKLELFDYCWGLIDRKYPSFFNIDDNWDTLRTIYRLEIEAGVSRGRFHAIMNHLISNLLDLHSRAFDAAIASDSLKPGTPLMVVCGTQTMFNKLFLENEYSHFGAGLAPLADSSLFVYDVVENHPLGLERGDVILGYDKIPWKNLYKELLTAELPFYFPSGIIGSNSASAKYHLLTAAGENWHLFDTIDIVKYASGDTIHLQTSLLHNQNIYKLNSDQMGIRGVLFPDIDEGHFVSWGVVDGTQTGYIYVWNWLYNGFFSYPTIDTGDEFKQAVLDLVNEHQVDGLIIDSRCNLGGYLFQFTKALSVLYNEDQDYYMEFIRDDPADHYSMKRWYNDDYIVTADDNFFDKPIAVLTGPNSMSCGDMMPLQMRTHPMVRTFGLGTNGAFGVVDFPAIGSISNDWVFWITLSNLSLTEQPDEFLTHLNIPPDEEIWLTQEDVAKGEDTVVKRALEWIQNLAHAHDVTVNKTYAKPGVDSVIITAQVENPNQHELEVTARLHNFDGVFIDSFNLFDDGMHGDSIEGDNLWGNFYMPSEEQSFTISVETKDNTTETSRTLPNVACFTSIGPVVFENYSPYTSDTVPNPGDPFFFNLTLKNESSIASANNVEAELISLDTLLYTAYFIRSFDDISAGEMITAELPFRINISEDCPYGTEIPIVVSISSNDFVFWKDTFSLVVPFPVSIDENKNIPTEFRLHQNYPNPFNVGTIISYQLPESSKVELNIYTLTGKKVTTLVSKQQPAGIYKYEWDASSIKSGVYYYKLTTGDFVKMKKLILIK